MTHSTLSRKALIGQVALAVTPEIVPASTATGPARSQDSPGAPVSGQRTPEQQALVLLRHALKGTIEEQRYLFRAASRTLGIKLDEEQADASEAIKSCMSSLGLEGVPARDTYRVWQGRQPAWQQWPTHHAVAKAFGSWSHLRAHLEGTPVPSLIALGLGRPGTRLTRQELIDALRRWNQEAPDTQLREEHFRRWAIKRLVGSSENRERLAVSKIVYLREFGSWMHALAAAGLFENSSFEVFARVAQCPRQITDQELIEHIRQANKWCHAAHGRDLTADLLKQYRLVKLREHWEARRWEAVPSGGMVIARFAGSTLKALEAAGIINETAARERQTKRGEKLTLASLATHVWACAALSGADGPGAITRSTLKRMREHLIATLERPVPSDLTIIQRFGKSGWPATAKAITATEIDPEELAQLTSLYTTALSNAAGAEDRQAAR